VLRCWVLVVESGPCDGMGRRRPALAVKRVSRKVVGRYRGREMDVRGSLCGLKERGGVCVALLRRLCCAVKTVVDARVRSTTMASIVASPKLLAGEGWT